MNNPKQVWKVYLNPFSELSIGRLLSTNAQVLYFRLILINNRTRWSDTFQTTVQRLLLETGIKSKHTLDNARKELVDAGFIEYMPGKDKKPSTYRLIPLAPENIPDEENFSEKNPLILGAKFAPKIGKETAPNSVLGANFAPETALETAPKTALETAPILDNNIHKDKNPKTAAAAVRGCVREGNLSERDEKYQEQGVTTPYAPIAKLYSDNIHKLKPLQYERLCNFVDTYGTEWTYAAVEEAVMKDGHTLGYVESILERWKRDGFKSSRSQAQSPQQSQLTQNLQIVPLPARRMPPQPAQRKLLGIDGLRAMWEAEKK